MIETEKSDFHCNENISIKKKRNKLNSFIFIILLIVINIIFFIPNMDLIKNKLLLSIPNVKINKEKITLGEVRPKIEDMLKISTVTYDCTELITYFDKKAIDILNFGKKKCIIETKMTFSAASELKSVNEQNGKYTIILTTPKVLLKDESSKVIEDNEGLWNKFETGQQKEIVDNSKQFIIDAIEENLIKKSEESSKKLIMQMFRSIGVNDNEIEDIKFES